MSEIVERYARIRLDMEQRRRTQDVLEDILADPDTVAHATVAMDAEIERLRAALTNIYDCAKGIMPIHENMDYLRNLIISLKDARWTRLFAIYAEAAAALEETDECH